MPHELTRGTRLIERAGAAPMLALREVDAAVVVGGEERRRQRLGLSTLVAGSSPDADIVVDDPTVSAAHLDLQLVEGGCLVRDLGSKNGTYLGDVRLLEAIVAEDAILRIGDARIVLIVGDNESEVPLSRATNFGGLLGHGASMRSVFAVLDRAARAEATVLITGESGTGKELAARALHDRSPRSEGPYVVFDCAAVAPTLVESQLFGHAKGSFTGATDARAGVFEQAHGGTLVLDEIGELPLDLQPKLLRALESRTVQRVGESKTREVSVRFVACTHRNLSEEVKRGAFREDLFFRLSVISVRMPPLRERRDEVPRLIAHFRRMIGGDSAARMPPELEALLARHMWPGNVRELRNVVERFLALPGIDPCVIMGTSPTTSGAQTEAEAPPLAAADDAWELPFHDAKGRLTDRFEQEYLSRLLAKYGANISEAARVSGLSRQSCYRLMHKHGLRVDE